MLSSSYKFIFLFKQKTAYEIRISDWCSDVCSSDLSPIAVSRDSSSAPVYGRGARMQERGLVIIIAAALALCGCEASSPEELASKAEQKASAARFEQIAKLADQSCMCAMAGRDTSTLNLELERLTASLKKEGMEIGRARV